MIHRNTAAWVVGAFIGMNGAAGAVHETGVKERPSFCPSGWECIPTSEMTKATERLIDLQEQIARLKIRSRHFGCVGGVGLGISGVVTDKYDAKAVPAGHAGVTCGWVF